MTRLGVVCKAGHTVVLLEVEREIDTGGYIEGDEAFAIDVAADKLEWKCPDCGGPLKDRLLTAV